MNRTQKIFFKNFKTYIRFQQRAMGEHQKSEWKGMNDNFIILMTPLVHLIGSGILTPDLKASESFAKLMHKDLQDIYFCESLQHVKSWRQTIDMDVNDFIKRLAEEN